ncbi:MAG: hypothetical protein KAW92_10630 [Candidatus Cloacimonetes bacterium]|nr:hypothetical protein [Candidatus Cloacimonadota bacterium]
MDYYYIFEIQNDNLWKFHCKRASWEDVMKYITNVDKNSESKWKAIRGIGYDINKPPF